MMGAFMFGIALYQPKLIGSMIFAGCAAGSMVSVLLTISRGALAVFVMGIWIVTTSLIHRYINFKNVSMMVLGGIVAIAIFASAADTLMSRFLGEQDAMSDIQYRGLYNEEARMMAVDHPFGVGIGNFSTYSWIKYGAAVKLNEYGTQAHNLWFLTLGELGYPGLFAFIGYWLRFAIIAIPFLFRRRNTFVYAAAGAAASAVLVGHIQFMLQLSYRQTSIFMMTKIFTGIVVAALYIHRDSIKEERRIRHAEHLEHWND
jgi:O-antigen ligase